MYIDICSQLYIFFTGNILFLCMCVGEYTVSHSQFYLIYVISQVAHCDIYEYIYYLYKYLYLHIFVFLLSSH